MKPVFGPPTHRATEGSSLIGPKLGLTLKIRRAARLALINRDKPAVLLLHGFPTSSQMFRSLADRYHVLGPPSTLASATVRCHREISSLTRLITSPGLSASSPSYSACRTTPSIYRTTSAPIGYRLFENRRASQTGGILGTPHDLRGHVLISIRVAHVAIRCYLRET